MAQIKVCSWGNLPICSQQEDNEVVGKNGHLVKVEPIWPNGNLKYQNRCRKFSRNMAGHMPQTQLKTVGYSFVNTVLHIGLICGGTHKVSNTTKLHRNHSVTGHSLWHEESCLYSPLYAIFLCFSFLSVVYVHNMHISFRLCKCVCCRDMDVRQLFLLSMASPQGKSNKEPTRTVPERVGQLYYAHGLFCSSHPVPVITFAIAIVLLCW